MGKTETIISVPFFLKRVFFYVENFLKLEFNKAFVQSKLFCCSISLKGPKMRAKNSPLIESCSWIFCSQVKKMLTKYCMRYFFSTDFIFRIA